MPETIEMGMESYIECLERRREEAKFLGTVDDAVWKLAMDVVRECGVSGDTDPKVVVDNLIVNADVAWRKDFREGGDREHQFREYHGDWDRFVSEGCLTGDENVAIVRW